jgi:predicted GNAT family N-acyltransferase
MSENNFYCIQIEFATPEFDEALALRYEVLRKPLNMEFNPDDIAQEYDSYHIACYENRTQLIVGVLILKPKDEHTVKMRQVAVSPAYQSKGIGTFMVEASEIIAKDMGYHRIELHARDTAVPFYKKMNYSISGSVFKEVGIDHFFMSKELEF